jgi:hypothetical protein
MKDPIQEYTRQGQRLDEIFGWLNRTFGSKPSTTPASFLDAMNRYKDSDTDADCANMDVGDKLNRKVAGTTGTASVTIGKNTIKNIKGIRFELLDNKGKGTGSYDNAIVNDFKCYDLSKDIYGIKWLFDDSASYEAESITGDLKAGVKNQSVAFFGKWKAGLFQGKFMSDPKDFSPGSRLGSSATFAFGAPAKKATRKPAKKTTKKTKPKTGSTMTSPVTVGAVSPSPVSGGKTKPMTAGPIIPTSAAAPPTAPVSPTGKKGGKGKKIVSENTVLRKPITIRGFLEGFM